MRPIYESINVEKGPKVMIRFFPFVPFKFRNKKHMKDIRIMRQMMKRSRKKHKHFSIKKITMNIKLNKKKTKHETIRKMKRKLKTQINTLANVHTYGA